MSPVLQAMMDLRLALPGPVTRKDGMVVPVFIDDRELLWYPEGCEAIRKEFVPYIERVNPDIILGGVTAGAPLAILLGDATKRRAGWVRKEPKQYSLKVTVDGPMKKGDRVLLVDDFFVTGEMKETFMGFIHDAGGRVTHVAALGAILHREFTEWGASQNVETFAAMDYKEASDELLKRGTISKELHEVYVKFTEDKYHWHEDAATWKLYQDHMGDLTDFTRDRSY